MVNFDFHFSFSIFLLVCVMVCPSLCHTNSTSDELALLAFKYSIKDPYNNLANWSNSSSICNWVGVTCDAHHRRVRILNLGDLGLEGTLPLPIENLLQLHKLNILNLSHNGLYGEIPPCISNFSKLETLDLRRNFIKGSVPHEIGRLQNLKSLRISGNKLSGIIPPTISGLSSLVVMALSYNSLTGDIPKAINNLTNLEALYLSVNKLSGQIPRSIGNLTMLQQLQVGDNNLQGPLPMEIVNLHMLEMIQLSQNNLSGPIPSEIFNMSALQILAVQNNSILGNLPPNFGGGHSNLEELYLWGNKLFGRIPNTISNASKLTRIELQKNKFTGDLPSTLGHLRYLEILVVYHNNLTIIDASNSETSFLNSLSNCRKLKLLDLSLNPLYIKLPKSTGNLSDSLQNLYLHYSGINGNIPSEIGNLTNLIRLTLDGNFLNGPIPISIRSLQALQYLSLEGNELCGLIVDELCEIKSIAYLYFSGNKFSGALPSCLENLTSLRKIDLSSNKLSSEIPSSFWNLKDILEVNLSSNILNGNLPLEIGNLNALTLLDLSRNHISSIIPATMGGLLTLQHLSLAVNELHGNIPESFGSLLSLVDLDLSQNNLSGEIPKSLESLVHLVFVNLSYNKLHGEIPSEGIFKNLTVESFMMNEALCGQQQLKVPPCRKERRKRSMAKWLLLKCILPICMSTILIVLGIILLQHKKQNSRPSGERDLSTLGLLRRISYFEIVEATNGFDESNLLGRGSYGSVFKGKLSSGMMVAFKIFNFDSDIMSKSFDVECDIMRNVRHRNLVKIISNCFNVNFKCLVMELMPNGNLEKWLYSHNYCLDFLQRLNIMINVADALDYLHHGLLSPVVHCDLKPNNILLDNDMIAHVSDFGISKLLDEGQSKTHTKTIPTVGYIAPEYGSSGVVSTKVDVYSFGIILIEVFTRKRPTDDIFVSGLSLKSWVRESMPHAIIQVMDSNLLQGDEQYIGNILTATSSIFELALHCCANFSETRSNMTDVVVSLNKIKVMFLQREQKSY